jgi:hypothetical protein
MTIRRTRSSHRGRGLTTVVLAAGLALGVTGCGGEDPAPPPSGSTSPKAGQRLKARETPAPETVLHRVQGPDGIVMTLQSIVRDSGFVTVNGHMHNTTEQDFFGTSSWNGDEEEIVRHGGSLGGATLNDKADKKRYYVLRDTEGRPLCTDFPNDLPAGKTVPIFAQFPAPPTDTTKVDLQLPGWPSTTVEISG